MASLSTSGLIDFDNGLQDGKPFNSLSWTNTSNSLTIADLQQEETPCSVTVIPTPNLSEMFNCLRNPKLGKMIYIANQLIAYIRFQKIHNLWPLTYIIEPDMENCQLTFKVFYFSTWNRKYSNPDITLAITPLDEYEENWNNIVRTLDTLTATDAKFPIDKNIFKVPDEYDKTCIVRAIQPPHVHTYDMVGQRAKETTTEFIAWFDRQRLSHLWEATANMTAPVHPRDSIYYIVVKRKTWYNHKETKPFAITPAMTWKHIAINQQEITTHQMHLQQHELYAHKEAASASTIVRDLFTASLSPADQLWLEKVHQWGNQTWMGTSDRLRTTFLI